MGWGVSRVALTPSSDKHGTLAYVTAPPNFKATQAQLRGLMHTRSQGNARDELCSHLPAGHGELMLLHHGMGRSAVEWQVTQGLRAMNLRTPPLFQYLSWLHQCNRGNANCLPANEAAAHLVTLQLQWDGTVRPSNLSATTTTPRQAPVREEDTSTRGDTMETGGDHEVDREETHRRAAQQFTTEAASVHARPTHGRHAVQRCTPQGQSPPAETPGQLLLTAVKSRSVYFRCCGVWPVARPVGHSRGSQRARLRFVVARVQSWCPLKTTCTRSDLLEVLVLRDVDGPYVLERVCHCPCPADEQTADHPVHCRYKELLQAAVPAALNTLQTLEVPGDARAAHVPVTLPNPPQTLGWDAVLREDVAAVTGNGGTVVCITSIRGQHVYFTTTYNEVASAHATRVHTVSLNRTTKKYRCACSARMTKYNTKRLQKQPKQRDCVHIRAVRLYSPKTVQALILRRLPPLILRRLPPLPRRCPRLLHGSSVNRKTGIYSRMTTVCGSWLGQCLATVVIRRITGTCRTRVAHLRHNSLQSSALPPRQRCRLYPQDTESVLRPMYKLCLAGTVVHTSSVPPSGTLTSIAGGIQRHRASISRRRRRRTSSFTALPAPSSSESLI